MSKSATNIAILLAGLVGGWASALYSIQSLGSTPADDKGIWSEWETGDSGSNNPYAVAHFLLEGHVPPAIGLFRSYFADKDDEGNALDARCSYRVTTTGAGLRWWSFATGRDGGVANQGANTITSDLVLAGPDGVEIAVSPQPASGNWLQPPASGTMQFAYMVAAESKLGRENQVALPGIRKVGC
jgi:hypothetical protein